MASWYERMITAVEHAYERRLQQASAITAHAEVEIESEEDAGEIVNLPRGVAVARPETPQSASE